ncbi:uncharacterized protein N7483_011604 [Penicillium malachiteum]|uniref:uncharacterized protein n=1 Tax=Penicillium malachiteum TaxID=1324776 RepID=UPI002546C6F3|nr:uncharacterized protein N7483_011604 [Penicillium malachiteum]KAJ5714423.1 hypothetical protein N7483_011604 [Penicillium malachiteum]
MIYPNRDFTFVSLFFFLLGLFVNNSWARAALLNTESTLNADNFRFDLSWSVPKEDHDLACRAIDLASRTDGSYYAARAQRGSNLECATQMDSTTASARLGQDVAAQDTTTTDMENAGWILITDSDSEIANDRTRISGYLDGTLLDGLSVDLASNVPADWKWVVRESVVLTKAEYDEAVDNLDDMAEAQYKCWYNVAGGLIIVDYAWAPSYIYNENNDYEWWPTSITTSTINALTVSKLSDVIYNEWASQAGSSVDTLQYVIQLNVVNANSRIVMNTAIQNRNSDWSQPEVFKQGSTEFNALLGSPNGNPQAWLLINHKADLGIKTVPSIMLWTSSTIVAGESNTIDDDDKAKERSMCWVEEEGYYGLCQHMLFTFDDVSSSDEDAMDFS